MTVRMPQGSARPALRAAAALLFALAATAPALAQSGPVTIDRGVLDALGPAPAQPTPAKPAPAKPPPAPAAKGGQSQPASKATSKSETAAQKGSPSAKQAAKAPKPAKPGDPARAEAALNKPVVPRPVPPRPVLAAPAAATPSPAASANAAAPASPPPAASAPASTTAASSAPGLDEPLQARPPLPAPSLPAVATLPPPPVRPSNEPAPSELLGRIAFEPGSSELTAADRARLDDVVETLTANPRLHLDVLAYADGPLSSGALDQSRTRRLSLARALAVRGYLVEKGVAHARVDVRPIGVPREGAEGASADRADLLARTR